MAAAGQRINRVSGAEQQSSALIQYLWHEGTIGVPKKEGGYTIIHYWVKAYDEPSEYGINCGKISKATLKQNDEIVYNFDRGLDVPPQTEEAEMALAILMQEYN